MRPRHSQLRFDSSRILDCMNLFSILTGHTFYTSRHPDEWGWWHQRLSPAAHELLQQAQTVHGSHMLGATLSLMASALPNLDGLTLPDLFADPRRIHSHFQRFSYYDPLDWPQYERMLYILAPVAGELEALGLSERWRTLHLPQVRADIARLESFMGSFDFDLGQAVADMLGRGGSEMDAEIRVYVCSYAAPHGIKLCGQQFITQPHLNPRRVIQTAIHEMFHPPYRPEAVQAELAGLIADPLFQDCWGRKDPVFGYHTELGFLEENVVEAITVLLGERAGVVPDPVGYLVGREGDVYRIAVVLYSAMRRQPKTDPAEPFAAYFQRLMGGLAGADLTCEFQQTVAEWRLHPISTILL